MLKKLVVAGVITAGVAATALGVGSAQANDGPTPTSKSASRLTSLPRMPRKAVSSHAMRMARAHTFGKSSARYDGDPRPYDTWGNYDLGHHHHKTQVNETFNVINLCGVDVLGLDHLLTAGDDERGKCAQASYNQH